MVSAPRRRHTRRALQPLRIRNRRNKEAKRLRDQPGPASNNELRPPGNSSSPGKRRFSMNSRHQSKSNTEYPMIQGEVTVKGKKRIATKAKGMGRDETSKVVTSLVGQVFTFCEQEFLIAASQRKTFL